MAKKRKKKKKKSPPSAPASSGSAAVVEASSSPEAPQDRPEAREAPDPTAPQKSLFALLFRSGYRSKKGVWFAWLTNAAAAFAWNIPMAPVTRRLMEGQSPPGIKAFDLAVCLIGVWLLMRTVTLLFDLQDLQLP